MKWLKLNTSSSPGSQKSATGWRQQAGTEPSLLERAGPGALLAERRQWPVAGPAAAGRIQVANCAAGSEPVASLQHDYQPVQAPKRVKQWHFQLVNRAQQTLALHQVLLGVLKAAT